MTATFSRYQDASGERAKRGKLLTLHEQRLALGELPMEGAHDIAIKQRDDRAARRQEQRDTDENKIPHPEHRAERSLQQMMQLVVMHGRVFADHASQAVRTVVALSSTLASWRKVPLVLRRTITASKRQASTATASKAVHATTRRGKAREGMFICG